MNFSYHFPRTRVKICGFTRTEDAVEAARLGVDAIGLVFYPSSPRAVDVVKAREIVDALPPFVTVVALFVNESAKGVQTVLENVEIDLIQFHGDENSDFCEKFGMPYVKAIGLRNASDFVAAAKRYPSAKALLLDAWHPDLKGGTGTQFDWNQIPHHSGVPIVLAGGLNKKNVAKAIELVHPYALDVSSGVETSKGVKDAKMMADFLDEVHKFERSLHERK